MLEKTLVIVKPEHVDLASLILTDIDTCGNRVKTISIESVPKVIAEQHYSQHNQKPHYKWLLNSFINNLVVLSVYEGKDVIKKIVDIVGSTDPSLAGKHTIRARYSNDSKAKAIAEERTIWNVVHRSDSLAEAKRELNIWKKYIGVLENGR